MRNNRKRANDRRAVAGDPPGRDYLYAIGDLPRGERCACEKGTAGYWLVEHSGKLYTITPNNQLQKDMWLGKAKREVGEDKAIAMLRWCCKGCGKVQVP